MKLNTGILYISFALLYHGHAGVVGANQWQFTKATFIPPANPPVPSARSSGVDHGTTGAVFGSSSSSSLLQAKKKSAAPAASKKIQVKLLKHVAGTGQAGDVVMVTPPFFNNKLRPTKSAQLISNEQVELEQAAADLAEEELQNKATSLKEQLEGEPLVLTRKTGPDGQLFGGIGAKNIIDELKATTGAADFMGQKGVKITGLTDGEGKKMRGDIKHTGSFKASISLTKDIRATVEIEVKAE